MKVSIKQAPIGYIGTVTLTTLDRRRMPVAKKTIKNNGVNNLFMLLCNFLSGALSSGGDTTAIVQNIRNKLPRFLAIGSPTAVIPTTIAMRTLQDTTEMDIPERFQLVTNGSWIVDINGLVYIQFSCNIPHTSVGARKIKEIGLFPSAVSGTNDMLARITLTTGTNDGLPINEGQSLLINWRIYFTNNTTAVEAE